MNLSPYELVLISLGSGIVGTLLGVWLGYKLTLQLAALNDKRQANQRLISTFHCELSDIYPYPIKWPENIDKFLRSKFTALNAATGEFRHYLTDNDRDGFDKTWFCFYNATGREIDNKNCQCYHHYMPSEGVSVINGKEIREDNTKTYKEIFKKNVDRLLKYAKQI